MSGQAPAQITGTVVRVTGPDTVPVAATRVVLHRLARRTQGPLDSTITSRDGRFGFRAVLDTQAVYLLSARHSGIEHFSEALAPDQSRTDVVIVVSDTSSTAPVSLAARILLVAAPENDSTRTVMDVHVVENSTAATRVSPHAREPSWSGGRLPQGGGARIEEGTEFSPDAIALRNDSLLLYAPVSPGRRQIVLGYRIPLASRQLRIPVDVAADTVTVLGEEPGLSVDGPGLRETRPVAFRQGPIRQWSGSVKAGEMITLRFTRPPVQSEGLIAALVGLVITALVGGVLLSRRRSWSPVPVGPGPSATELLDQVARLDVTYKNRRTETPTAEWAEYESRRKDLVTRLATALARRSSPT